MTDREAFEAWWRAQCRVDPDDEKYLIRRHKDDGRYLEMSTFHAWKGYQSALASERAKQVEPVALNLDAISQAIEERDAAQRALDDLAQHMVYKGNSVAFIYQKAAVYRDALDKAWDALRAAGIKATGSNTVADGIAELASAHPAVQGEHPELKRLSAWLCSHDDLWQHMSGSPVDVAIAVMSKIRPPADEAVRLLREASRYVPVHDGMFHNPYIREREDCDTCKLRSEIDAYLVRVGK